MSALGGLVLQNSALVLTMKQVFFLLVLFFLVVLLFFLLTKPVCVCACVCLLVLRCLWFRV
jgi:hypothetical protein